MARLPEPLIRLAALLERLPGVGPRTAEKLAYHLARRPTGELDDLASSLKAVAAGIARCADCGDLTESSPCAICADPGRDRTLMCVVAESAELHALERLGEYRGLYHVLGGTISPIEGIEPAHLRVEPLLERLSREGTAEIILALNPDLEGETTSLYLSRLLRDRGLKVTKLARGLPTGSEIEYADDTTLSNALTNRRAVNGS